MTSVYTVSQAKYIAENIIDIMNQAKKNSLDVLEPTMDEYNKVMDVIKKYIRNKKRKIYGGYALHRLILNKGGKDGIYNEDFDIPDIEFYSPEPLEDIVDLCNLLHDSGFKKVQGKQAMHEESYTVFVNYQKYCDISYVPKLIYNYIPTISIDGMLFTKPKFLYIDMYRVFNDPMTSYWRLEKTFKRMYKLQKAYPFYNIRNKLQVQVEEPVKNIVKQVLKEYIKEQKELFLFGYYAYNYYIRQSGTNKFQTVDIPHIDVVSIEYKRDCENAYTYLKSKYNKDISVQEYYPFFQFHGYKTVYMYRGTPILSIYDKNNRCIPFHKTSDGYNVTSFQFTAMMLMILELKTTIDKQKIENKRYNIMLSNLMVARNDYLNKNNKTVLDNTPFREFQLDCMGKTLTQDRIYRLQIDKRKKEGKKLIIYYTPQTDRETFNVKVHFDNTSGNLIRNEKNRKHKFS